MRGGGNIFARINRFAELLRKELIFLLKSPKTRFTLLVPPLIQIVVLGYAATMDLREVKFAVLDYSRSAGARELIGGFRGSGIFVEEPPLASYKDMHERIDRREIKLALVIPPDFEREMHAGRPSAQIIVDARNSTSAGMAIGYAQSVADAFNRGHGGGGGAVEIRSRAWFNENYSAQYFMIPALLATIALLDMMMLTSLAIAREREDGTFDQLLLTPYSPAEILAAKGMATMTVGMCQLTLGLMAALWWFQIPFVSGCPLLYAMFLSFLFASAGIGLLISVHCRDLQQAMLGTFLVAVPFAMLSGMLTPIDSMPEVFQRITLVNPIRYGIEALHRLFLEGARFGDLARIFVILWSIGIAALTAAYLSFTHQRRA